MKILIVDDSIEKISELTFLIYKAIPNAIIETAENILNAIDLVKLKNYNLAVVDLVLPLRQDGELRQDGGNFFINEIYRKKELQIPNYIVGITQHENESLTFSSIWKVIQFRYDCENWKNEFNLLLNHIVNTNFESNSIEATSVKPSIFTEGLTDKTYIEEAIDLFYPEKKDFLHIISQKNAGANWVANQVPIWAMKLQMLDGVYIKAIGLLDSDEAGNIARKKIEERNLTDNEKRCCSIYQLKPSYSEEILKYYKLGCKIEIEIESLFPTKILKLADDKGWLEYRVPTFVEAPKDWIQHEETTLQYIERKNNADLNPLYLKKVKISNKDDFRKLIQAFDCKHEVYSNFKILLDDLFKELAIF
ncbi:response regulator [Moheibacter sediminis]|uniref:Response regulator receiver domain-containing protein n=1 Tax=Moheibacter sediminis TaxID=1434700 RepID=A0A1W1YBW3_9FLAO|nr:response regulator [Moheibacter sediminis]SMC33639.1 hypothetical protein SAMN06296427_101239 [Moheibacter sediminis]